MVGYSYDTAGNVMNDGLHTYTYDAENRIVKISYQACSSGQPNIADAGAYGVISHTPPQPPEQKNVP